MFHMDKLTPYLHRKTLRELIVAPWLKDMRLSAADDHLVLDLVFRRGFCLERAQLLFNPTMSCLKGAADGKTYLVHHSATEAEELSDVETIESVINQVATMVREAAYSLNTSCPETALSNVEGICVARGSIEKLARNVLITDLVCGRSATECVLQFQMKSNDWFDVSDTVPLDWVGLEFTATYVDFSWFDRNGRFHSRCLTPRDAELEHFLENPIAWLPRLEGTVGHQEDDQRHPVKQMLDKLRLSMNVGWSDPTS